MAAYRVYILSCRDNSLYTGWTTNVAKRIKRHNRGVGAKYTRSRLPVRLVYTELLSSKRAARKREAAIKKLSRQQKMQLIAGNSCQNKRCSA